MPCRFADMPPHDFELFVAQYFQHTGFDIEQVKHGSDYGIDVIVARDQRRIGIQVKRYAEDNKVGVQDVNQAVGGVKFYNCDHVIFITTSDFTQPAQRLANETGVELWNWNEFQRRLSDAYLGGSSFQEYFGVAQVADDTTEPISAEIVRLQSSPMQGNFQGYIYHLKLSNRSASNLSVQIVGATYIITRENYQYSMRSFLTGYFDSGVIYAGCTVEAGLVFDAMQLQESYLTGDKIILDIVFNGAQHSFVVPVQLTQHQLVANTNPKSGCFISTAAFGSDLAPEVVTLRKWRDNRLRRTAVGRLTIALYYFVSPTLASWIRNRPFARMITRKALCPFVCYAIRSMRRAR